MGTTYSEDIFVVAKLLLKSLKTSSVLKAITLPLPNLADLTIPSFFAALSQTTNWGKLYL